MDHKSDVLTAIVLVLIKRIEQTFVQAIYGTNKGQESIMSQKSNFVTQ